MVEIFRCQKKVENLIRKYYPAPMRHSCEIDDRYDSGEISDEQREKEWDEWDRRYNPEIWLMKTKDQAIKDEYYRQAILGSWKNQPECNDGKIISLYTFLSDGEVWYSGHINISDELELTQLKCDWQIKDSFVTMRLKSIEYEDSVPAGEKITFKILSITNDFFLLLDDEGNKHTYRKVGE